MDLFEMSVIPMKFQNVLLKSHVVINNIFATRHLLWYETLINQTR